METVHIVLKNLCFHLHLLSEILYLTIILSNISHLFAFQNTNDSFVSYTRNSISTTSAPATQQSKTRKIEAIVDLSNAEI